MTENEKLNYYIRCAFCNKKENIVNAVLDGWVLCNGCQFIFCDECQKKYENNDRCPGSLYSLDHKPAFSPIPIEDIEEVAESMKKTDQHGKYIARLFYNKSKLPLELGADDSTAKMEETFRILRFREEQWKKFGIVLVKRKDGKFVSWGQIDN